MFAIITLIFLIGCNASPNNEGLKWTHNDLFNYLKKQGLIFEIIENDNDINQAYLNHPSMNINFNNYLDGDVIVRIDNDAQQAKDAAGINSNNSISWGRFYIHGNPELLSFIQSALEGKKVQMDSVNIKFDNRTVYKIGLTQLNSMINNEKRIASNPVDLEGRIMGIKYGFEHSKLKETQIVFNPDNSFTFTLMGSNTFTTTYRIVDGNHIEIQKLQTKEWVPYGDFKNNGKYLIYKLPKTSMILDRQ
jgi:hypothetical protein